MCHGDHELPSTLGRTIPTGFVDSPIELLRCSLHADRGKHVVDPSGFAYLFTNAIPALLDEKGIPIGVVDDSLQGIAFPKPSVFFGRFNGCTLGGISIQCTEGVISVRPFCIA